MNRQLTEINFPVTLSKNQATIEVSSRLSVLEAINFKETCKKLTQQVNTPITQITIDFHQTTFIDSSGLGSLVSNLKTTQEKGIDFKLKNVTPQVMTVLNITGLDVVFPIEVSTETTPTSNTLLGKELSTTHPSIKSWIKRTIDIIGALVGLIITGVLFIPIAIAIKIDDPGPIFFDQIRCGWMSKRFKIWKFRSMCVDAEAKKAELQKYNQVEGAFFKIDKDPRITKVGRFLRKTSLDELPQFWNVLKGEMSLVGTRPPTPNEVESYEIPEWQRLDVKPGMTGEWQVNGRSSVRKFEDVIRLDLQYQKNWSLFYDLKLIFKTVQILFTKSSGAV